MTETFGKPIFCYTRADAIRDGVLVDVSRTIEPCPFKYPVAMTRAAWEAVIQAGGQWAPGPETEFEELQLPAGQDIRGRTHDVFTMMRHAIARGTTPDRIHFSVLVDVHGNGRKTKVDLYSICGPGDTAEPVITILLRGED
jgi:hypothetical protein